MSPNERDPIERDVAADNAEHELLRRIRADEAAAFETLFREHYESMCALAFRIIRSRDTAEDIAANVFRNVWRIRLEWSPSFPLRAYLLTATRNEALNALRSVRRRADLTELAGREDVPPAFGAGFRSPDEDASAREIEETVGRVAETLPEQCRKAFLLRWRDGLKHREIAERMDLSIKTVEMHLTRALRTLRERLQDHR